MIFVLVWWKLCNFIVNKLMFKKLQFQFYYYLMEGKPKELLWLILFWQFWPCLYFFAGNLSSNLNRVTNFYDIFFEKWKYLKQFHQNISRQCKYLQLGNPSSVEIEMPIHKILAINWLKSMRKRTFLGLTGSNAQRPYRSAFYAVRLYVVCMRPFRHC